MSTDDRYASAGLLQPIDWDCVVIPAEITLTHTIGDIIRGVVYGS